MTVTAKPAKATAKSAKSPAKRATCRPPVPQKTVGQRLIEELSQDDDPYPLQLIIEQAGYAADYLARLNALLDGDREAWLQLKIGAKTVEVVVNNVLVQQRQQAEQMRKLITEVYRQRAALPADPDDDDVLAGI
ncbi:hypothetical protein [Mycobacteroides immunogenum]|uniref:Terminase n=1 Tax=Mycobacteroides immunogenum TaxID=83262 RepID=A0A7V8LR68_9MYCO|nr:hypothetical protein [Mycobacteroides immunogenum]AMT72052.1 hypothetical protein ABG82_18910 [Mycobacteroides immunogenum]ANO05182.1 hypothetical protein BAB75_19180 [Mycobacteroides immunogenum]KIU40148.1 hypothetical protein TL11_12770 [Mycobacteroides immunogenum]KPG13646.1 hypothetical protein AN909_05045 [Mycobacteroides immunogenum]KPG14433.1 hypothetical protein AN908_07820 [Mycobacteroides immunogenum]